jgi:hypothetical protein
MRVLTLAVIARIALAALAGSFAAVATVAAADVPETMAQWGLLGTWASDCAMRPSPSNTYYTWVRRGRDAFLDRDYGQDPDSNRVLAASVLPDGAIELRVEFKAFSQTRVNAYIKGDDGRIRMFTNHDMHDSYSVKDGKLVATGTATAWDTRCR